MLLLMYIKIHFSQMDYRSWQCRNKEQEKICLSRHWLGVSKKQGNYISIALNFNHLTMPECLTYNCSHITLCLSGSCASKTLLHRWCTDLKNVLKWPFCGTSGTKGFSTYLAISKDTLNITIRTANMKECTFCTVDSFR